MTKYNYYHVDCGHFPAQIKLCFSDIDFQSILRDHDIKLKATALDEGVAETHYLTDGKMGIIVMVFDLAECGENNPAFLAGVVAHEASHCVTRVFDHIGEDKNDIGDESRSYLLEHIVKQIHAGIEQHKAKQEKRDARKGNRKLPKQTNQGDGRTELQVDQYNTGSPRPDSYIQGPAVVSGTENSDGNIVTTPANSFQRSGQARISSNRHQKHIRRGEPN